MKIVSIAPTRISLFGGGTDLVPYSSKHGGMVISLAINLRQKITMYSDEEVRQSFPPLADPAFYNKILEEFGISANLQCEFDGLIEAGLGSSASAAVALIGAINKRLKLGMSLDQIAEKAWELEVGKVGLFGGKQDQYAAAYGGFNIIDFEDRVNVFSLVEETINKLLPSMVLLYTGKHRKSSVIQEGFKELTTDQVDKLDKIKSLAFDALNPLMEGDIMKVGSLLDQGWLLKRQSNSGVSNSEIDDIYRRALEYGAFGGKVLGSGGGGYMLFIVEPMNRENFIERMGLQHWEFSPDFNGLEVRDVTDK